MLAALALAAALHLSGNFVGPGTGQAVVCDSSTVPVQSGGVVVCVAPSAILGNMGAYLPVQGYAYPVSLGGWYGGGYGGYPYYGGGFGGPRWGGGFRGGFGHGFDRDDCTTTGGVRTCVSD